MYLGAKYTFNLAYVFIAVFLTNSWARAQEVVGAESPDRCFFCEAIAGWFWMILAVILFVVIIGGVAAFSAFFFRNNKPHKPMM